MSLPSYMDVSHHINRETNANLIFTLIIRDYAFCHHSYLAFAQTCYTSSEVGVPSATVRIHVNVDYSYSLCVDDLPFVEMRYSSTLLIFVLDVYIADPPNL